MTGCRSIPGFFILAGAALIAWTSAGSACAEEIAIASVVEVASDTRISSPLAGHIERIEVTLGDVVEEGQLLIQIDDQAAQEELRQIQIQHEAELTRLEAELTVATEELSASRSLLDRHQALNESGIVTPDETISLRTQAIVARGRVQTATAELAALRAMADADQELAELRLARHALQTPIAGTVTEVRVSNGEYVQPGDRLLRIVNLDRLHATGLVYHRDVAPHRLVDRPATVTFRLENEQNVTVGVRVVHVATETTVNGHVQVTVEFENERVGDFWRYLPGMNAEMRIDIE